MRVTTNIEHKRKIENTRCRPCQVTRPASAAAHLLEDSAPKRVFILRVTTTLVYLRRWRRRPPRRVDLLRQPPIPQHDYSHLRVHGATTARLAHEVRRLARRRHGNPLRSLGPQTRVRPTLYNNTQTPTAVPRSGASPPSSCPPRQTASRVPPAAPVSSASPTSPPSPPHTSSAACSVELI